MYKQPVDDPVGHFVSIFAGCGGFTLGLVNAGWRGKFVVEKNSQAFCTLKHNLVNTNGNSHFSWPRWLPCKEHDIKELNRDYARELRNMRGVKLVAGGPPCQGFSLAGRRKANDPRNLLIHEYIKFVKLVQPKYIILENVRGITSTPKQGARGRPCIRKTYADLLRSDLLDLGIYTYPKILHAFDFGIPQRRERYIMLGIREDLLKARKINPDQFDPFDELDPLRTEFLNSKKLPTDGRVSPGMAISDLEINRHRVIDCEDSIGFKQVQYEKPLTHYQALMRENMNGVSPNSMRLANHRPEIENRFIRIIRYAEKHGRKGISLSLVERQKLGVRKHSLVVLDPNKPTHTITTLPDDILHYSEPRILTVRENARLQSFPDWFEFTGTYTTGQKKRKFECPRYTQVGNAVPPFLAEILGRLVEAVDKRLS